MNIVFTLELGFVILPLICWGLYTLIKHDNDPLVQQRRWEKLKAKHEKRAHDEASSTFKDGKFTY